MSTKCVINFCDGKDVVAKVYRHSDGYPGKNGVDEDLKSFFEDVRDQCSDTRFGDASYLAAKFVVWQANKNSHNFGSLNFLGVGVVLDNPSDIEYEWFVECISNNTTPHIRYNHL